MATKRTWIWIIVGVFGAGVLVLIAVAGAGIYFVTSHVATARTTNADAFQKFDQVRAEFKNFPPLIDIDSADRPRAARPIREIPTSKIKPTQLWVMAWDPDDERLVKISIPFWVLRLGHRKVDVMSGDRSFDLDRLNLDVNELERIGPALVFEVRAPSGERVLLWTQ